MKMNSTEGRILSTGDEGEILQPIQEYDKSTAIPHNPYYLRRARNEDIRAMEALEKEIMNPQPVGATLRQEMARGNAVYLLAIRDFKNQEIEVENSNEDAPASIANSIKRGLSRIFYQNQEENLQPEGEDGMMVGMAGAWHLPDNETHIVTIGTRENDRRKGVGELLLIGAIEIAMQKKSKVVTLEVRCSNSAAKFLYKKYRFSEVAIRKNYYTDNGEDSIVMTTPPIHTDEYRRILSDLVRVHEERWGISERIGFS